MYWDTQDPKNEGWAYRIFRGDNEESGPLEVNGNLDDAIREACFVAGVELEPSDFASEPNIDGGFADWVNPATIG